MIRTAVLFVLTLAGTACAPDPATEAGAGPERIDCGVPNCSLRLPPGVMPVAADGTARRVLEHAATGVRMEVRVLETTPTESDAIPAELARLLDREEARLAPAVRFSQPPRGPWASSSVVSPVPCRKGPTSALERKAGTGSNRSRPGRSGCSC